MSLIRSNQNPLSLLRIFPLSGMPFGSTTSNALTRSVATIRYFSPRSKISRTFPERTCTTPFRSTVVTACIEASIPSAVLCPHQNEQNGRADHRGDDAGVDFAESLCRRIGKHHERTTRSGRYGQQSSQVGADDFAADVRNKQAHKADDTYN